MDREVRLYIEGHAFKMEGEKYGFFPVDVTSAWMNLFPTYDAGGSALKVEPTGGRAAIKRVSALVRAFQTAERKLATRRDAAMTPKGAEEGLASASEVVRFSLTEHSDLRHHSDVLRDAS